MKRIGESASVYHLAGTNYPVHFKRIIKEKYYLS
jgi:hypothetical protein